MAPSPSTWPGRFRIHETHVERHGGKSQPRPNIKARCKQLEMDSCSRAGYVSAVGRCGRSLGRYPMKSRHYGGGGALSPKLSEIGAISAALSREGFLISPTTLIATVLG